MMSIAESNIIWTEPYGECHVDSDKTLGSPLEGITISAETLDYADLIVEQRRAYESELLGEKLLHEVVEAIRHLAPLEMDGDTQQLLDAAIQHQDTGGCDDLYGWASRLAKDVGSADD